jgi:hypothetical protein
MTSFDFRLRSRIMIPVGLGFLLLCLLGIFLVFFLQQDLVNKITARQIQTAGHLFNHFLDLEAENIETITSTYLDDSSLQKPFVARNREALLQTALPRFRQIKSRYDITHFYFHLPDGTCFLRVHDPERHSDLIRRYTMIQAQETSSVAKGIELGPLGTFTLRVVTPWFSHGTLIGFIELGKEIDHLAPKLHDLTDMDFIFAINKKHLDRNRWEEGMRMMGLKENWDKYPNHVIASSTLPSLPSSLRGVLERHQCRHDKGLFEFSGPERALKAGCLILRDAGANEVGDMIIASDVTPFTINRRMFLGITALAVLLISLLYFGIYFYFGRQERLVEKYHAELNEEIAEHQKTGQELVRHRDQLDRLVQERTAELEKALSEIKVLSGLVPICASCKNIRNEDGTWEQIEKYISHHSEMIFSHSYCPKCAKKLFDDFH